MVLLAAVPLAAQQPAAAPETKQAPPAEQSEGRKRVELNLLGKEDSSAGESRRNENVQFNQVDNNALKELNVRLGATPTLVGEFQAERSYFGAEFGNAPSAVLRVTPAARAGWHGRLFANHQNSIFNARSFFQVGDVKPAHENRYGAAAGGHAWRGGYVSFDGSQERIRGNVNGNVLVPMPDERTPLTTDPAKRALVAKFLAGYPAELPNRTDINPRALNTNAPQSIDTNDGTLRAEQDLGSEGRLLSSYRFLSQTVNAFQLVAGQNPDTTTRSHTARLTWVKDWSGATTTSFAGGFDRVGSLLVPAPGAMPMVVSPSGLATLGPAAIIPIDRAQNLFRAEGQVRALRSRHEWNAGYFLTRRQFNGLETDAHRGYFGFSNDFGRTGIENLRMGTPSQYIVSIGDVRRGFRQWLPLVYAGDKWHATTNLTLQFGLRYEPVGRPVEVNGLNTIPYGTDWNNVAPRFGFAYRIPGAWGVLRGGAGVDYSDIFPVTYSQVRFSPPRSVKLAIPAPDLLDPLGALKQTGASPDARGNRYVLDPKLASPYAYQYNFSWEPAISRNWRLQLGYVGSRSHKLLIMWYLNRAHPVPGIPQTTATINERRANPQEAETRWVLNGSQGYFDAARASLVAPRVHGFTLETAYSFSKAMDLGANYTNTAYDNDSRISRSQSEFETQKDRKGLSLFDQPHSFLARLSYETPAHGQGWAGRLTRNWVASSVVLFKQGTPFTVTTLDGPGYGNVDGNGNDRPNLLDPSILGRTIGNPDTSVALLPKSAFAFMKPTDAAGNLGVATFRKGGIRNVNASLSRYWQVRNEVRLTLRAESINLTNTPQFAEPGSILGAPEFGTITNTLNDGRALRFGLTVLW
ncbi:MAG TPA: TonB-dependent receptor [Bryobacteraceae bacterium]